MLRLWVAAMGAALVQVVIGTRSGPQDAAQKHKEAEARIAEQTAGYMNLINRENNISYHNAAYVAFCVIVRDEPAATVLDWLRYHHAIGVNKFYFYDHMSATPVANYLQQYIKSGLVDVLTLNLADDAPDELNIGIEYQTDKEGLKALIYVYNRCILHHRHRHTWMAMLDVDEYAEVIDQKIPLNAPGDNGPLPNLLREYAIYGSLIAYWRMFGACGLITSPAAPAPYAYTCCTTKDYPANRKFVKTFVNVQRIQGTPACGIHTCYVPGGMVDEYNRAVPDNSSVSWDRILIRHYQVKSFQEFLWKQQRGFPHPESRAGQEKRHRRYANWNFAELEEHSKTICEPLWMGGQLPGSAMHPAP